MQNGLLTRQSRRSTAILLRGDRVTLLRMRMLLAVAGVFLVWGSDAHAQVTYQPIAGDPVSIDGGQVSGTHLLSGVKAYFGIPYAAPPVRGNRWRAPQPVQPWTGVYIANRKAPECIQPLRPSSINQYFGEEATSEDCLYLNLWAPKEVKPGVKLPVVVWIYGGAYTYGSASAPVYSGESLARKGVIYIALNYRVGVMGFLAHPELTAASEHRAAANWGLLDQIAALQWVSRNIVKFGGDPANVTIAGQSAGSLSVSYLQVSPLAAGLFTKLIGMSGSVIANDMLRGSLAKGEAEGVKLQKVLKADSVAQMRTMSADHIAAAAAAAGFQPEVLVDGWVLPQEPSAIFAAHRQNDVPALIGSTADDLMTNLPIREAQTAAEYQTAAVKQFGANAAEFLRLYPANDDEQARKQGHLVGVSSGLGAWSYAWARDQALDGHAPVWLYRFSRVQPVHPGTKFSDFDPSTAGSFHSADIPYWLGTLDTYNLVRPTRDWTSVDRRLETEMSDVVVAFARTGRPDTSAVQLPRFNPGDPRITDFGNTVGVETLQPEGMMFLVQHSAMLAPSLIPGASRPIY